MQRGEVFAGDALGHVAYTGAMAALAAGINPRAGLFVAPVAVGLALGVGGVCGGTDEVAIGSFFSWVLGPGVLFPAYQLVHAAGAPYGLDPATECRTDGELQYRTRLDLPCGCAGTGDGRYRRPGAVRARVGMVLRQQR
ncbi:hypothetical protein [Nocardia sp. NBC_01388]|uniref:hypothetical protein n=1 Tax=Nocardia sp. NBC_01388 TaxID=2903596 RepID=UPI00324750B4